MRDAWHGAGQFCFGNGGIERPITQVEADAQFLRLNVHAGKLSFLQDGNVGLFRQDDRAREMRLYEPNEGVEERQVVPVLPRKNARL